MHAYSLEANLKVHVITGSRADRNCVEPVNDALIEAGHESRLIDLDDDVLDSVMYTVPDVVVLAGDRSEILECAMHCAFNHWPICHIAGGDVTRGSQDDRYRDAITALACIHCTTNYDAFCRVLDHHKHKDDDVRLTGSPAIDRIMAMPRLSAGEVINTLKLNPPYKTVVVAVHPNTLPGADPFAEVNAIIAALEQLPAANVVALGANADPGGARVNAILEIAFGARFHKHLDPQLYYSLLAYADVMVGNSSAGLYEAPCFNLPFVLVGERQEGRIYPANVLTRPVSGNAILDGINCALSWGKMPCTNPYGHGGSAAKVVRALEENSWRWERRS